MNRNPGYQNFELNEIPYKLHVRDVTSGMGGIWDKHHAHQGMEFVYVQQGEGIVMIEQKLIQIKPGAIFYFQPFQLHRMKIYTSESSMYIRSKILFEPEIFYSLFEHLPVLQKFFVMLWKEQLPTQMMDLSDWREELDHLFELYKPNMKLSKEEQQERFSILLINFLHLLQHSWPYVKKASLEAPRTLNHTERALEWIENHYREPFDLRKMADALYLNRQYLSRLFRSTTGHTISDYVLSRRLREACVLICTTELPIQEIAMHIGIPNVSRFCQVFRQKTGLKPLQYRVYNNNNKR